MGEIMIDPVCQSPYQIGITTGLLEDKITIHKPSLICPVQNLAVSPGLDGGTTRRSRVQTHQFAFEEGGLGGTAKT